ncbi:putative transcription factor bHLH056 [Miscanthus floridulus]|uniref:putative transcription factor bHLH056 n=1 Tax=Miscanthus floridulus TaxID=154761 RepID=UPI00345A505D
MEVQPTTSLRLLSPSPVALPPSEDDMAAWLYPIVSGQEHAVVAGHDDHQQPSDDAAGLAAVDDAPADHNRERPPNMEEKCHSGAEDSTENYYSCGSRKKETGGARRSHSHPEETHNLTEKRRRRKINEKLKTLRQLVPGCDDKSNEASTLDQTIQHIKSLQQQIQVQSLASTHALDDIKATIITLLIN